VGGGQLDGDLAAVAADLADGVAEALAQPGEDGLQRVGGLGGGLAAPRAPASWLVRWASAHSRSSSTWSRVSPFRIFSCSRRMPSISISGRGGQPGTYMSTGTIWSTPWTMAELLNMPPEVAQTHVAIPHFVFC